MGKKKQEPQVKKEPVEEIEKLVDAVVDGVEMALNIRKDPEVTSNNQIAVLKKGTKIIVVNPDKTVKNKDGEWYKVRLKKEDAIKNGYAMKKYIKVV